MCSTLFEVQAFDYLVKPLQEDNFSRTMSRLLLSIRSHKGKQLLIQKGTEWSIVPFDDIVYCEIINRKGLSPSERRAGA